ncbi:class I SAM-dependent methyltransferase [Dictyobacter kobayashii]|uniref:Methyltransferase domain-containing protein n=1 Tax=Dictyobacter kobayashii TaxID=2014872 RepID=A0A402AP59_9CHLR|nr:class I SAM-dependent methyltransferase [Dictyobacter kobayashii]GCE20978.1 hypothetical protein KDK_47780 [Dictyobacter kobayashii]
MKPFNQDSKKPDNLNVFMPAAHNDEPDFRWDDGRRHVANVPYMLPSDLTEVQRLDFQHYMLRYAFKGNYLAPIKQPKDILDVACGTGRWMFEQAQAFPQANIMGIDLVPPRVDKSSLAFPKKCVFTQGNVVDGLPFVDQTFDFVHQRLLILGIQARAWPRLLYDLYRVTRPGGWIEIVDTNLTCQRLGPETTRLAQWVHELKVQRGIDPSLPQRLGTNLKQVGLTNVSTHKVSLPVGLWGGRIGSMMLQDMIAVTQATRPFVTAHAGITTQEYDRLAEKTFKEYEQYKSYSNFYVAYGQRTF